MKKKKKAAKPPAAAPAKPAASTNLVGAGGRLFANPAPGVDETSFQVDNTSSAYYNSPYYLQH